MALIRRFSGIAATALVGGIFRMALQEWGVFSVSIGAIVAFWGALIMFISDLSTEWALLLLLVSVVAVPTGIFMFIFVWMLLRNFLRSFSSDKYWKWSEKLEKIADDRKTFWRELRKAHSVWLESIGQEGPDLSTLVNGADIPRDMLTLRTTPLRVLHLSDGLNSNSVALSSFAQFVYPDNSQETEKETLDIARRSLSKFWDFTGRLHFHFMDLSENELEGPLRTAADDLIVLIYLEWALARRLGDAGVGKQGLFKLASLVEMRKWRRGTR
jgi:hypothetical protein